MFILNKKIICYFLLCILWDVKYTQEDFFMSAEFLILFLKWSFHILFPSRTDRRLYCRLWNDKIIYQIYPFRSKFR